MANGFAGGEVRAIGAGRVVDRRETDTGFGSALRIEHAQVTGEVIYSIYAHMVAGSLTVNVDEWVSKGQKIGEVNSTGLSTGHHLHFSVRIPNNFGCGYVPSSIDLPECKSDLKSNYRDPLDFVAGVVALPLDTAHWQYWTYGFRCLSAPQMLAPAPGLFEQTSDGLRAYADGFRSCNELHSIDKFNVLNKTVYTKWKPDGARQFMGINIYFHTADTIPPSPNSVIWHVSSSYFTTLFPFASIVVQDNVWYYSRVVFTASTMTAYTARGNYDDQGGMLIDQNTLTLSTSNYDVRLTFGFSDQYASTAANLTIGEVRIVDTQAP